MGEVTKVKLKRIGVISLAEYMTLIMLIFGVFYAIIYSLLAIYLGSLFSLPSILTGIGVVAIIIIIPIAFAVMGFIFGAIGALLYNLIARLTGGVSLDLEES